MGKMANNSLQDHITNALRSVSLEEKGENIVDAGMISSLNIDEDNNVITLISVNPERGPYLEEMRQNAERAVCAVKGVQKVSVILTSEKKEGDQKGEPQKRRIFDPHGMAKNPPVDVPAKHIIVVASGKGGVGKSTVSANLAVSLAQVHGKKVGLLDADIYGPSQPVMMGGETYKPSLNDDKKLVPAQKHGLKIMSIGFIADSSKALVWRGPMVQTAFYQMLRDVAWATPDDPLDYLVIDLPPGTGDVQLTLAQKVHVSGAIIVSTPQDIALIDARRAVEMFGKTGVPVIGLIENMSTHICSQCGHEEHIFGNGGAQDEAKKLGIPFLGEIPLSKDVRLYSDQGVPIVTAVPDSSDAQSLVSISNKIVDQ